MRIETDIKYDFSDVLIKPKRSTLKSRKEVDLTRRFEFKHSNRHFEGIPIISANMDTISTFAMSTALQEQGISCALHKHYSVEELVDFFNKDCGFTFYSMGIGKKDLDKFNEVNKLVDIGINHVCIDVANGYSETFVEFVNQFRQDNPDIVIMAGNVVTSEMTEQLLLNGADIVKVGIGSGSCCTTRKITGIGYPQMSAVFECADAAHGLEGLICSDGGCTVPGDVVKAFAGGADFVMLGGMLAGHTECGGQLVHANGNGMKKPWPNCEGVPYMKFYGMSSKAAMDKHSGGVAEYRASEGKEVLVKYKGPVKNTINEILGGLRSACTYTGSVTLKELSKRTTFILVNNTHNKVFGDE